MWLFKKRRSRNVTSKESNIRPIQPVNADSVNTFEYRNTLQNIRTAEMDFAVHMSKYAGETVTVFVKGGGTSGLGFSGILLDANHIYIRLITGIGPAPSCALFNACQLKLSRFSPLGFNMLNPSICNIQGFINSLGSVVDIPINKIASFVHNAV